MSDAVNNEESNVIRIPEVLPILPLFNTIIFPKMMLPLEVIGDQSILLVDEAMSKERMIGVVLAKKSRLR